MKYMIFWGTANRAGKLALNEFAVLGVVDLEAMPPGKEDIPLGDDDNPIPLVQFTNIADRVAPPTQTADRPLKE